MSETILTPHTGEEVQRRYEEALNAFVARVQRDSYIIAAILYGSLAYDTVWEKSDVDMLLVTKERNLRTKHFVLVENGVSFSVSLETRSRFKAEIEGALQGAFMHSAFSLSKLLFTTDDSIRDLYRDLQQLGSHDRQYQLLRATTGILPMLTKAEKWLVVKKDPVYSFVWFMYVVSHIAQIEVLWHGGIPKREALQQALHYNPLFFNAIYTNLVHCPKDEAVMLQAIESVHHYLDEKIPVLFKPVLDYLAAADGSRSITEINEHLSKYVQSDELLDYACEWLAQKGILQRVSSPVRLTEKSQTTMDEAAYYYDRDANPLR